MTEVQFKLLVETVGEPLATSLRNLFPSRRERIATAAMQGMLASDERHEQAQAGVLAGEAWTTAALALQLADALIEQLDKEPTTNPAERGTEGTEA
jgi:hypothetical protein